MNWGERAEAAVARYRSGERRGLDQRQLTQLANAAWAAGLSYLMVGLGDEARTSLSAKRMLIPLAVESRMSLVPSVILTATRLSPSSMDSAMIPAERTLAKAVRSVFFTSPFLVTKKTKLSWVKLRVMSTAASFSSGET